MSDACRTLDTRMGSTSRRAPTKKSVIVDAWKELSSASAGARELQLIQQRLVEILGEGAVESPAAIARTLADNGVRLRHPEVLNSNSGWRERRMYGLLSPEELDLTTLAKATSTVLSLDALNREFEFAGDSQGVQHLRGLVQQLKLELEQVSGSREVASQTRQVAGEVREWLRVWLQNPVIFSEWLSLRLSSDDFTKKFG
jgi:hypothetical protein